MSGDTLVVGARDEDSIATGVNGNQADNSAIDSGAAYVFQMPLVFPGCPPSIGCPAPNPSDPSSTARLALFPGSNSLVQDNDTSQDLDRVALDSDRDFFMSALEAKEYGLVDDVMETLKKPTEESN